MTNLLIKCESVSSVEAGYFQERHLRVMLMDVDVDYLIHALVEKTSVEAVLDCLNDDEIKEYLDQQS